MAIRHVYGRNFVVGLEEWHHCGHFCPQFFCALTIRTERKFRSILSTSFESVTHLSCSTLNSSRQLVKYSMIDGNECSIKPAVQWLVSRIFSLEKNLDSISDKSPIFFKMHRPFAPKGRTSLLRMNDARACLRSPFTTHALILVHGHRGPR